MVDDIAFNLWLIRVLNEQILSYEIKILSYLTEYETRLMLICLYVTQHKQMRWMSAKAILD